jgi:hypothetical protein
MRSFSAAPGIGLFIIALVVASEIITQVTGEYSHWVPVTLGIVVGLLAVRSIR